MGDQHIMKMLIISQLTKKNLFYYYNVLAVELLISPLLSYNSEMFFNFRNSHFTMF